MSESSNPSNGITRRGALKFLLGALGVAAGETFIPGFIKDAFAAETPIVFRALNKAKSQVEYVFCKIDGQKVVVRASKPLTEGAPNADVSVKLNMPGHGLSDVLFSVKNGEWTPKSGNYKDGQRYDQDKDAFDLGAKVKAALAAAQEPPVGKAFTGQAEEIDKIDDRRRVAMLCREGYQTRVDIPSDGTDFRVTMAYKNEAFTDGQAVVGPLSLYIDRDAIRPSEMITDIANQFDRGDLVNPASMGGVVKRQVAATLLGLAFREAQEIKTSYVDDLKGRLSQVPAGNKAAADNINDLLKKLGRVPNQKLDFLKEESCAAFFESALKGDPKQTMAKLTTLLTPAPAAPEQAPATPPAPASHL